MSEGDPGTKGSENPQRPAKQGEIFVPQSTDSGAEAARIDDIYLSGQASAFGIPTEEIRPSRINGVVYQVPEEPRREFYRNDWDFGEAQRNYHEHIGEGLASQEKHALSGVPFN